MTEQEAAEQVKGIAKWIVEQVKEKGDDEYLEEPKIAQTVRGYSTTLLKAAKANGEGGCKLCRE